MEAINILEIEENQRKIINNDSFSVEYLFFEAGKGMPAHTEKAKATIQILEGRITFVNEENDKTYMMPQHTILEFDGRSTYSIIAHEDSKILMTIVPIK
jgi:calcineurin-like phosphoesterase family protein